MGTLDAEDFIPCPDCAGYFAKCSLWRHQKNCTIRKGKGNKRSSPCQKAGKALLPTKASCNSKLPEILAGMRADDIVLTIRSDPWLCKLGEYYISDNINTHNIVSENMRRVARLLLETQKVNACIKSAKDLIDPSNFDDVVHSVKTCCGFNDKENTFEIPSLAKKLGQSLTVLAEIVVGEAIKTSDSAEESKAEQFLKLKKLQWKNKITSQVYKQQCKDKWLKPKKYP